MRSIQYTIRNIPGPVNQYLRKKARLSGKSLNQVVIEELSEKVAKPTQSLVESLDWFIGSNSMDEETRKALEEINEQDKKLAAKEM